MRPPAITRDCRTGQPSAALTAAMASPLVVVCVTDYEAVRELLGPLGDVLAARVLVNLTSGTSTQARLVGVEGRPNDGCW